MSSANTDFLQVLPQQVDLPADHPTVRFDLLLPRTFHPDAPLLLGQVRPESRQPRQHVLKLGQFDLRRSLGRPGAFRENMEDDPTALQHLDIQYLIDVPDLRRTQVGIEDHQIAPVVLEVGLDFIQLARSDVGSRIDAVQFLEEYANGLRSRCFGEQFQFCYVFLCLFPWRIPVVHPYQDGPFQLVLFQLFVDVYHRLVLCTAPSSVRCDVSERTNIQNPA